MNKINKLSGSRGLITTLGNGIINGQSRLRYRGSQGRWSPSLVVYALAIGLALCIGPVPLARAAIFKVDRADDNAGATGCSDATGNDCSLRGAILAANNLEGPDVINLAAGTYRLTLGQLQITDHITIQGAGANVTIIDASKLSRVFKVVNVLAPADAFANSTIANFHDLTIRGGNQIEEGGGIFVGDDTIVQIARCVISDNFSQLGGGGIFNSLNGYLSLRDSAVRNNTAEAAGFNAKGGGGIANLGVAHIYSSTISGNGTRFFGGGISNGRELDLTGSTVSGNKAGRGGGGLYNQRLASINFCTITLNEANLNKAPKDIGNTGGGIHNTLEGNMDMANTILAGNTDQRISVTQDGRISRDFPASLPVSPDCFSKAPYGFITYGGNLLGAFFSGDCDIRSPFGTDITFWDLVKDFDTYDDFTRLNNHIDPKFVLDSNGKPLLANNGGPTQTHALRSDSPAIDHATGLSSIDSFFACPETDQRGLTRPVDGDRAGEAVCDIGAFEFGAIPPEIVNNHVSLAGKPVTSLSADPTSDGPAGTFFITSKFTNTKTLPIRKPFFRVTELSNGNLLLNADSPPGGVGARLTPDVGPDQIFAPGDSVTVQF